MEMGVNVAKIYRDIKEYEERLLNLVVRRSLAF